MWAYWHLFRMGHVYCLERPAIPSTAICQAHHQYMHFRGTISGRDFYFRKDTGSTQKIAMLWMCTAAQQRKECCCLQYILYFVFLYFYIFVFLYCNFLNVHGCWAEKRMLLLTIHIVAIVGMALPGKHTLLLIVLSIVLHFCIFVFCTFVFLYFCISVLQYSGAPEKHALLPIVLSIVLDCALSIVWPLFSLFAFTCQLCGVVNLMPPQCTSWFIFINFLH